MVLDETESLDLQSGVASKEDIAVGPHTVKIYDGHRQVFTFVFASKTNQMPELLTPLANQPVGGAVIASLAGAAKIYTTSGLRAAAAPPAAPVPPLGLVVSGTPTNPAHFVLDVGKGRGAQEQSVNPSAFPTLTVQLAGATEASYLGITANVPDCQLSVDGKPIKRGMQGMSTLIPIDPGSHPVRLSCPGYEDLEKVAVINAGDSGQHKLDFVLTPIPAPVVPVPVRRAVLMIAGAPPDTPVFQNQIRIGTVGPDGNFSREVDPGTFTWEWRRPGYDPRKETRSVKAGENIRLDGTMAPSSGSLLVKVVPEGARISVYRDSDSSVINAPNNVPISLAAGSYRVTAALQDYRERSESFAIAAGKPLTLNWELEKVPLVSGPMRFFENGDSWKPLPDTDGWWIHPGSGYSTLRASTGAVAIDFLRKKRSRKINVLADCQDHSNCIIYSIDSHNFAVKVVSRGSTVLDEKSPHGMDDNSSFHLIFEMTPDAIVVKNRTGTVLSSVNRQNPKGKLSIQDDNPLSIN